MQTREGKRRDGRCWVLLFLHYCAQWSARLDSGDSYDIRSSPSRIVVIGGAFDLITMANAATVVPAASGKDTLRRELGLASATAAVAGESIAVGIFLTPAGMAKSLASPFWLLIVWLAVGAMTLSGALCYGELAGRFPSAGGAYVYLRECFGPRTAFLYGWMCLLVLDPGLTAAFATGFAAYATYIFHWPPLITKLAAIAAIWAICVLNIF